MNQNKGATNQNDFIEEILAPSADGCGVTLDDFVAYMPGPRRVYIFAPTGEPWSGASVNARLPRVQLYDENGKPLRKDGELAKVTPTWWLDQNRPVEQMVWCPGEPMLIRDRLVKNGGWVARPEVTIFNLYQPPRLVLGDGGQAGPWIDHVRRIYPDDADHSINWLAHRVQRPQEKINHALVWGGAPGIGKDTLLEPVKHAVGPWNFYDISPGHLLGRFNNYAKSVILRVNEARDLGEANRFSFYDHAKIYCAAPPDVLRVDEKNLREYYAFNVTGFVITTNHKSDGIYLPADDRRHYVGWSNCTKDDFTAEYWNTLWGWYYDGGFGHVAAYLASIDLSGFDPKAPPPKTPAFWDIISANVAPEDGELADLLDALGNPDLVTLVQLRAKATGETAEWLLDRRHRRSLPHRLERCGYVSVRNPDRKDGLWKVQGVRQAIYGKAELQDPSEAAKKFTESMKQ